eukprot:467456-Alexandrium_andersonii.AAC.1
MQEHMRQFEATVDPQQLQQWRARQMAFRQRQQVAVVAQQQILAAAAPAAHEPPPPPPAPATVPEAPTGDLGMPP